MCRYMSASEARSSASALPDPPLWTATPTLVPTATPAPSRRKGSSKQPSTRATTRPAEKLLDAIRSPVRIEEQELFLTASVGVSVYPADGHEHDTLLRHADTALYRAKALGRNRVEVAEPPRTPA